MHASKNGLAVPPSGRLWAADGVSSRSCIRQAKLASPDAESSARSAQAQPGPEGDDQYNHRHYECEQHQQPRANHDPIELAVLRVEVQAVGRFDTRAAPIVESRPMHRPYSAA